MRDTKGYLIRSAAVLISISLVATSIPPSAVAQAIPDSLAPFNIPSRLGTVSEHFLPSENASPRVVLIQDLHLHYATQKRIVKILDLLFKSKAIGGSVGVEGVEGPYDTSVLANFPAGRLKTKLVDYFMKKGELSGDEAFSILRGDGKILYGIEKAAYYGLNRDLFRKTLKSRHDLNAKLAPIRKSLPYMKRQNPDLTKTVDLLERLLSQEINLEEAQFLAKRLPALSEFVSKLLGSPSAADIEETLKSAIDFYIVALMRDKPMADNVLSLVGGSASGEMPLKGHPRTSAIVTGGFHTAGITRVLQKAGIGYVVITPHIAKLPTAADRELYERRLAGHHLSEAEFNNDFGLHPSSPRDVRGDPRVVQEIDDAVAVRANLTHLRNLVNRIPSSGARTSGGGVVMGAPTLQVGRIINGLVEQRDEAEALNATQGEFQTIPVIRHLVSQSMNRFYGRTTADSPEINVDIHLSEVHDHPNAIAAYRMQPFLGPTKIVLDVQEMETLARLWFEAKSDKEKAMVSWLVDWRLHHELSHSSRMTGSFHVVNGLAIVLSSLAVGVFWASDYPFYGFLAGVMSALWGAFRHYQDKEEEYKVLVKDFGRYISTQDKYGFSSEELIAFVQKVPTSATSLLKSIEEFSNLARKVDVGALMNDDVKADKDPLVRMFLKKLAVRTYPALWSSWFGVRTFPASRSSLKTSNTQKLIEYIAADNRGGIDEMLRGRSAEDLLQRFETEKSVSTDGKAKDGQYAILERKNSPGSFFVGIIRFPINKPEVLVTSNGDVIVDESFAQFNFYLLDAMEVPKSELAVPVAFGTSGWRGLMVPAGTAYKDGQTLPKDAAGFSMENVSRVAQAIADTVVNDPDYQRGLPVGVGYDARVGAREFAIRVVEVLVANGIRVQFADQILPTPSLAEKTRKDLPDAQRLAIGIHLTASHNPFKFTLDELVGPNGEKINGAHWMGIKVMKGGAPASDAYTGAIAKRANNPEQNRHFQYSSLTRSELNELNIDVIKESNERLAKAFGFDQPGGLIEKLNQLAADGKLEGIIWNVLHGATTVQVQELVRMMQSMGLKVPTEVMNTTPMREGSIRTNPNGHPETVTTDKGVAPWGPEPTPVMYLEGMKGKMKAKIMAGIKDGDGDRAEIYDLDGKTTLSPNHLGAIFAHFLLTQNKLTGDVSDFSIVRTLPTTRNLDLLAKRFNLPLHQTPVGSKHFEAHLGSLVTATEESGHLFFRLGNEVFVDSAIGEFLLGLMIAAETGKSLTEYYQDVVLPDLRRVGTPLVYHRTTVKKKFVTEEFKQGLRDLRSKYPQEFANSMARRLGKQISKVDSTTDSSGILVEFQDGSWLMYRLSGTDGSVRIYGEDISEEKLNIQEKAVQDVLVQIASEKRSATEVGKILTTVIPTTSDPLRDEVFRQGGYLKKGSGVSVGSAINGSFAFEGEQGYYVPGGKEKFLGTVAAMRAFFERHERKRKPIRYIIKPGIGGQHTPFQGIADGFAVIDPETGRIVGEYELGKNFEDSINEVLKKLNVGWDQLAVIPSSKSGSTDETMVIFVQILASVFKHDLMDRGIGENRATLLTKELLAYMHELNIDKEGVERKPGDLFKGFSIDVLVERMKPYNLAGLDSRFLIEVFKGTLGRMFFETTDNPAESRLSAFIRNSGLDALLGDEKPGFGAMFENVGGRWTADPHMMLPLAYFKLEANAFYDKRRQHIEKIRNGTHPANILADKILDQNISDVAFVVPDEFYWFGKSNEQNFNESIWQTGFANQVAIPASLWKFQKQHYLKNNHPNRMVINLSDLNIGEGFNVGYANPVKVKGQSPQQLAETYADLFSFFYGVTSSVGNRLIARALHEAGYTAADVDMGNLDHPATRVLMENLYLRQPYVELGKGLVDTRFQNLQAQRKTNPDAISGAMKDSQDLAKKGVVVSNLPKEIGLPHQANSIVGLATTIQSALVYAQANGRKFVPFIYLEGQKFQELRVALTELGIEWVLQGTGDQHISYQQVLAQPQKFLPMIISFVPEEGKELPGLPAIGFAKAHLDGVSPHLLRDYFAEGSYQALTTGEPAQKGGQGIFIRLLDTPHQRQLLQSAFKNSKDNLVKQSGAESVNHWTEFFPTAAAAGIIMTIGGFLGMLATGTALLPKVAAATHGGLLQPVFSVMSLAYALGSVGLLIFSVKLIQHGFARVRFWWSDRQKLKATAATLDDQVSSGSLGGMLHGIFSGGQKWVVANAPLSLALLGLMGMAGSTYSDSDAAFKASAVLFATAA